MLRYWIHTTSVPHWENEIQNDIYVIGLSECDIRKAKQVRVHDKVVVYLVRRPNPDDPRTMQFCGTFSSISRFSREDSTRWSGGLFPLRLQMKPIIVVNNANEMVPVKSILDKLAFIKNKQKWGAYFQSSLIPISAQDWNTINEELIIRSSK